MGVQRMEPCVAKMERSRLVAPVVRWVYTPAMKTVLGALLLLVLGLIALVVVVAIVALFLVAMAKINPLIGVGGLLACAALARALTDWKPKGFLE